MEEMQNTTGVPVAPTTVRESDLIAVKKREEKIKGELQKTTGELAQAKSRLQELEAELRVARVNGEDDDAIKEVRGHLLTESKRITGLQQELEKREATLNEREKESRISSLAAQYKVDVSSIKDAEDPEKEALRLVNERLVKERENPAPAEEAFESQPSGGQIKKDVSNMSKEEFAKYEASLKAKYYQRK